MARRTELADVADGITGHVMRDTPWHRIWPLGAVSRAFRDGLGTDFRFDLIAGTAEPASRELTHFARGLEADLVRHLTVRKLAADWVRSAELTVTIGAHSPPANGALVLCRMVIIDDLDRIHTSTRRGPMRLIAGRGPIGRWLSRLLRGSATSGFACRRYHHVMRTWRGEPFGGDGATHAASP